MLLPLTIAIVLVAIAIFTVYAFRFAIARWSGKAHRQMQEDELQIRREYNDGLKPRG